MRTVPGPVEIACDWDDADNWPVGGEEPWIGDGVFTTPFIVGGTQEAGDGQRSFTTWSKVDETWSECFEVFDSPLIVWDKERGLWRRAAGQGLRVKLGLGTHSLRTPSAQGEIISLAEATTRRDEGRGTYLSSLSAGRVVDGAVGVQTAKREMFSKVNSSTRAFHGECAEEGEEHPRVEWTKARANMEMVSGTNGSGAYYLFLKNGILEKSRECLATYGSRVQLHKHGVGVSIPDAALEHGEEQDRMVGSDEEGSRAPTVLSDTGETGVSGNSDRGSSSAQAVPSDAGEAAPSRAPTQENPVPTGATPPPPKKGKKRKIVGKGPKRKVVKKGPRSEAAWITTVEFNLEDARRREIQVPVEGSKPPDWPSGAYNAWTVWTRFMRATRANPVSDDDLVLTGCSEEEAQGLVASWARALWRGGGTQQRMKRALSDWALAIALIGAPQRRILVSRERNLILAEVMKEARPTMPELQDEVRRVIASQAKPLGNSVINACWNSMWTSTNWDTAKGMDARGEHIFLLLGYAFGIRKSNAVKLSRTNPHGLLSREVAFQVKGVKEPITAGCIRELREALGMGADETIADDDRRLALVEGVRFRFLTGKGTRAAGRKGIKMGAANHWVDRNSPVESLSVDCFTLWELSRNRPGLNNCFLSRRFFHHSKKGGRWLSKEIRPKEAMLKVREAVINEGGDPAHVVARSLRVTFSTNAEEAGMPQEQINTCGHWAEGSTMSRDVYSRAGCANGLSLLQREAADSRGVAREDQVVPGHIGGLGPLAPPRTDTVATAVSGN